MKKLLVLFLGVVFATQVQAQITTPAPSPFQKIEQKVGLTDVTLEYSRPSMKGRTIFGDLVPYNKVWRTGANANTKITFSDDVMIGGSEVKAGTYAIYTKPMTSTWEIYFYSDSNNWGNPQEWDESKVVATVKADAYPMPMEVETFTMSFDDLKNDSAVIGILWDKTYVAVPFKVNTDEMVTASINGVMNGPSANDYYSAAVYYLENGKDINQAKTWIDKAVSMRADAFWYKRQQSLIYAKSGDKKGAIKAAKESMAQAKAAGNADYVALNEKSLKEWGAM
ncbi:DUF2911 domain-containing protein [Jejudonia soesokkakensis]|uniref:DUF2911 domain-containing protein n=1 Tax=Jejudonia soesokkakensis TaxID=1323432 RepID=A0ABW2MQQ9_9FLAO